jgi:hypothetical protein
MLVPSSVTIHGSSATPAVLKPYDPLDAIGIGEACRLSGEGRPRLIAMAQRHGLGRKIGARWAFSRIALCAFLNDDQEGLTAYLAGDRASPAVAHAYQAAGVPLQAERLTTPA